MNLTYLVNYKQLYLDYNISYYTKASLEQNVVLYILTKRTQIRVFLELEYAIGFSTYF